MTRTTSTGVTEDWLTCHWCRRKCFGGQALEEILCNACSCQLFSRHFTSAWRGVRLVCSFARHMFLLFFFFCHHFWDEPISGQCASTTFPFSFVVFLYPPSLSVRGEATHLQHVHLFPSPLWPVTTTLVARLGPPLHPSCAVRRLPTKFRGRWCFYLGGVVSGMI